MYAKVILAAAAAMAATLRAAALDATLMPDGSVSFGEGADCAFRPLTMLSGWKSLWANGGFALEKPGVAQFTLDMDGRKFVKAVSTLDQLPGGKIRISCSFTALDDMDVAVSGCALTQNSAAVSGRPWRTSKKSGTFSHPADGGISVMWEKGSEVTVPLGDMGRSLTFLADRERDIAIQDNRKWSETYSLRIGAFSGEKWRKDETRTYSFTVSADEPLVAKSHAPVVVERGREWIPLDYRKDIIAGSALDFSGMGFADAPAGKYGWMRNSGGHFEFEKRPGRPVRLYGVNLCFSANFPEHALAEKMVARFKRLGYNAIRLHHHDGGTVAGSKDGLSLNAENMDKFDYLVATAVREGLYLTTDLYVSRPVMWRHIGVDRDGKVDMQLFKALCAVYGPAFENWCAYARNFMTHVNPYTGRAYKDEPAMPLVSLVNEGGLFMAWGRETSKDERVRAAWKKWVLEKRAANPAFQPEADPENPPGRTDGAAFALFMGEIEAKMVSRMKAHLRGIGCKALASNGNCGPHYAPLQAATEDYDYIDDHFYVDHPHFLEKPWQLPSRCGNGNPVLERNLAPCGAAFTRMSDKPFTITEWNFSAPGRFRGVGGILTGALAALQDWSGMWRFAYAHGARAILENPGDAPNYFDLGTDPLAQASDRASICLFLRGDMEPIAGRKGVSLLITPRSCDPQDGKAFPGAPSWRDAAWGLRVGSCLSRDGAGEQRVIPRERAEESGVKDRLSNVPVNSSLRFDREKGAFAIETPRTCGGYAPRGTVSAGPLDAALEGAGATVWASSLDGMPLASSKRILVTHLTDVQGEGAKFAEEEMRTLLRFGKGCLVRNGRARISLALDRPSAYAVYGLGTDGARLGEVPAEVRDGRLLFAADVEGPAGARMMYEVVLRPAKAVKRVAASMMPPQ